MKHVVNSLIQTQSKPSAFLKHVTIKRMRSFLTQASARHVKNTSIQMSLGKSASKMPVKLTRSMKKQVNAQIVQIIPILTLKERCVSLTSVMQPLKSLELTGNAQHAKSSFIQTKREKLASKTLVMLILSTLPKMESASLVTNTFTQMQSLYLVCKILVTTSLKFLTPLEGVKLVVSIPMSTLKIKFVNLTSVMLCLKF